MVRDAFLKCQWPIWRVDNFTPCFRKECVKMVFLNLMEPLLRSTSCSSYLQIFLPLLSISISFLILAASFITHTLRSKKSKRYRPVPIVDDGNEQQTPSTNQAREDAVLEDTDSEESDAGFTEHLSLRRTMSGVTNPDTKINKPMGQVFWWSLEELAVVGQVALHLIARLTHKDGLSRNGQLPLVAQLITWVSVFSNLMV